MQHIKIHALDNVAVALADLAEGTEVTVDNQTLVTLRQAVAAGHKLTLCPIASKGENVIKYGLPIGFTRWWILPRVNIFTRTIRVPI